MNKTAVIASIVAAAQNNAIGMINTMIWHIPEDLKHFKHITMGKPIIMGRKSYESLGKPLPGRPNIVISRSQKEAGQFSATHLLQKMESVEQGTEVQVDPGPIFVTSIEKAIEVAQAMAANLGVDEIFITGGAEIYRQTLPITQRLYLTRIHRDYDADAFFPQLDMSEWSIVQEDRRAGDPAFTFLTLERKAVL